jgi:hypothetical protein
MGFKARQYAARHSDQNATQRTGPCDHFQISEQQSRQKPGQAASDTANDRVNCPMGQYWLW